MEIACFEAVCNNCGMVFSNPLLSDFSYGEFIARSDNGIDFAYLNVFDEPAIAEIEKILSAMSSYNGLKKNQTSCFHYVLGKCSDFINGKSFDIGVSPICPNCHSIEVVYDNIKRMGTMIIPRLTFKSFLSLSQIEKQQMIKGHITNYQKV